MLLADDHKTGWCSEIQSYAVLQTSGMNLDLDGYFCTHKSFSNCSNSSLSKNAFQVCGEWELDGHLKGLLVCTVVKYESFQVVGDSPNVQILFNFNIV